MRAVVRDRYGTADVLRVVTVDDPVPGPADAVVRVAAASLNTADLDHLLGRPRAARVATGLVRPAHRGVGLDLAGTVESVGSDVTGVQPGDRVWADLFDSGHGAFADRVRVPASALTPLPDGVPFETAATAPHSGTLALQSVRSVGPVREGERVLVNGAGGCVGPFAVQLAKARGAVVTAVDHGGKAAFLRELGADETVDHTREDVTRGGRRFDVVVDIADTRPFLAFRRCLAPGGRYVLVARRLGSFLGTAALGTPVGALTGVRAGTFAWRPNQRADLDELAALLSSGAVRPRVDRTYFLDEAPDAFRHLAAGTSRGKLLIVP
ncbi:NAD(P)-dependent alcohol dehydrogenase [Promicromonospora citrea]|uniref:NADPH:quinone reductase n=1 Tax=Promicromonospora citrea TaxID=43677 RepID=A0A8H9GKA7_9MICO|nr:NAD(P)-dependent alcohol dehydrogenase [Promicromonospora citrea]NNH53764.1 NAD(P)-dependent alcohol dehydrogenase [Promicromonospora citrea]GGM32957.1 NADPH:quinone reductase [Promicromonospora citrea]